MMSLIRCVLVCCSLYAATSLVNRVKPSSRLLSSDGPRHTQFSHSYEDKFGGSNHLSFDAIAMAHVISLDANTEVLSVSCDDESQLRVEVRDVRAVESWLDGMILAGTLESFQCKDHTGEAHPFTRELRGIVSLEVGGSAVVPPLLSSLPPFAEMGAGEAPLPATIVFATQSVGAHACFEKLELNFHRIPGPHEAEMKAAAYRNETLRRELGLWDMVSSAVGSVSSAASSAAKSATSFVSAASDFVSSGGAWGGQQTFDYSLINYNYDINNRAPIEGYTELLGGGAIYCQNCYAYLGANLKVSLTASWASLNTFELSAQAAATAGLDIEVTLPSSLNDMKTVCIYPSPDCRYRALPTLSFVIGAIPVNIYTKARFSLQTQASFSASAGSTITGPGFWYDNSLVLGIRFTQDSGWSVINDRSMSMDQRAPSFNIQGNAYIKATPIIDIIFSLWNSWDVTLSLKPWLSLNADFAAASSGVCGSGQFALTMQAGIAATISLAEPRVQLSIAGQSLSLTVPGLGAYFPIRYPMVVTPTFTFDVEGSMGCTAASSLAAGGGYYHYRRLTGGGVGGNWTTGNWSDCSVDCGRGSQTRTVLCISALGVVDPSGASCATAPAPASSQPCEPSCPYYFGSGAFNTTLAPNFTSEVALGQSLPWATTVYWGFQMTPVYNGLYCQLIVTNGGDPNLRLNTPSMLYPKRCQGQYNNANESVTLTVADDGIQDTDVIQVIVQSKQPTTGVTTPGYASYELLMRPFFQLLPSRSEPGTLVAGASLYYRYYPSLAATGVSFSLHVNSGDAEVYVSTQTTGWPSSGSSTWSTVTSPAGFKSVIITDDSYTLDYYNILVVAQSDADYKILAADIIDLQSGQVFYGNVPTTGLAFFRFALRDTDTTASVLLDTITPNSDTDLYVSRVPFYATPYYEAGYIYCPSCVAMSLEPGYVRDEVLVQNLDPIWSNLYYICVSGWYSAEFRIAAQSYEALDQGVEVRRYQQPSEFSYFLGSSPHSTNANDDIGLSFQANAQPVLGTPGDISVLAGSSTLYWPAVREGFQGTQAPHIQSGAAGVVKGSYLPGTAIARSMIIGLKTGLHGVNVNQQPLLGTPGAAGRRLEDGRGEGGGERALRGGLSSNQTGKSTPPASHKPFRRLPDIFDSVDAWETLHPTHASASTPAGRNVASSEGAAADAANGPAPFSTSDFASQRLEAAKKASTSKVSSTFMLPPSASSGRHLGASLASPELLFVPAPLVPVIVPVDRFVGSRWVNVVNCTLASMYAAAPSCAQEAGDALETIFLRVRVPARVGAILTIVASTKPDSTSLDAPYSILLGQGSLPTPDANLGSITGSSGVFRVANCFYTSSSYYIAVTFQNAGGAPAMFDLHVEGSTSDSFLCPNFVWETTPWRPCSVSCNVGVQTRAVWCQDSTTGLVYPNENCMPSTMPAQQLPCDMGSCVWVPGQWQDCPVPCGGGRSNRLVTCANAGGLGQTVIDGHCDSAYIPITQQNCNEQSCPTYLWMPAPWSACSAQCGGGTQARLVPCVKSLGGGQFTSDGIQDYQCTAAQGAKPPTKQACNPTACANTVYDVVYFDKRKLITGQPREDTIPAGGRLFYYYERPTAAAMGVCIVATPSSPLASTCTVASEKHAASCLNSMYACYDAAIGNATTNSITLGQTPYPYTPLFEWSLYSPVVWTTGYTTPPGGCQCFSDAISCLSENTCSKDITAATGTLSEYCRQASDVCPSLGGVNYCALPPSLNASKVASPQLAIYVSKLNTANDLANPFVPPIDASLATWGGLSSVSTGQQRLVITEGYSDSSADTIIIGLFAPNASVQTKIVATALSAYPITFEGSLAASGGVTAAQIRAGGLELILKLSCDEFVQPYASLAAMPAVAAMNASALGNRASANLIAAGLIAVQSSDKGFNRIVRPMLLNPSTPIFASFSWGMTQLTLILPPAPSYYPTSDEQLQVAIPSSLLRSGQTTPVEGLVIQVQSDTQDCIVSTWSDWSPCSTTCAPGLQSRTRAIQMAASGLAAACPATLQTRSCNTCDLCSTLNCSSTGLCALGACTCAPGFSGADCRTPPPTASTYFWLPSAWGACSANCEGGLHSRSVQCMVVTNGAVSAAPSAASCGSVGAPPATTGACNPQECTETRVDLTLTIGGGIPPPILGSDATLLAFKLAIAAELAASLNVAITRLAVQNVGSAEVQVATSNTTSITIEATTITLSILPPSVAQAAAANASSGGASSITIVGGSNADVLASMQAAMNVAASPLLTTGTYIPQTIWSASNYAVVSGIRGDVSASGSFSSSASAAPGGGGDGSFGLGNNPSATVAVVAIIASISAIALVALVALAIIAIRRKSKASRSPFSASAHVAYYPNAKASGPSTGSATGDAAGAVEAFVTNPAARVFGVGTKRLSIGAAKSSELAAVNVVSPATSAIFGMGGETAVAFAPQEARP